jgi:uncharacterized protein YecA (UPF0149 family)
MEKPMNKSPKNIHYLAILFIIFSLSACGGNSEEEEQSTIDKFTSETAQKAVQQIQDPLDKAHAIQALADEHVKQMSKDMEEME